MNTIPTNRYSVNSTMRMLGRQAVESPKHREMLEDVAAAYPTQFYDSYDLAMDMLHLGIIIGKRAERARRKAARSRMYQNEETAVAILFELLDTPREDIPQIKQELLKEFQDKPALTRFVQTAFSLIER